MGAISGTIPTMIVSLGRVMTIADGTEQTIMQQTSGSPTIIRGYLDLSNMQAADITIVRLYAMLAGVWILYGQETYTNIQPLPLLNILEKPKGDGVRVTIEQTLGVMRSYMSEFFKGGT
jgi:hypothetical protein